MENIKIQRINSDILRVLSIALRQKMNDDNLSDVNILRVETSGDLSETKVFISIEGDKQSALNMLEKAGGFLRNEIAQNIKIKQTPRLRFIIDKGTENAARVEELLKKINGK